MKPVTAWMPQSDLGAPGGPPARIGNWMQTFSGRAVYPMDLRPDDVAIEDIAHSLAMQCRFNGHCLKFYCPTPDQRVLTDDLRWVPAGDLRVGDGLLAFDEEPVRIGSLGKMRRRLKRSEVTVAIPVMRKTIRLVMSDGSDVVSSSEHPWLIATKASGNQKWATAESIASDIARGRKRHMHRFYTPWTSVDTRDGGWLAGIYDGEGYFSTANRRGTQLGVCQNPGPVLDQIEVLLRGLGFEHLRYVQAGTASTLTLQTRGGLPEIVRLLGSVRPMRLLSKFQTRLASGDFDKQMQSDGNPLEIVAAYEEGEQWVSGLETSSHTYFCEGFAAHNCVAEHSVLVSRWLREHYGWQSALAGLLHDASEAYLTDVPRPIKPFLYGYKEAEAKACDAVARKFGLTTLMTREVQEADNRILFDEKFQNMGHCELEWDAQADPLGVTLHFWSPAQAEQAFLDEYWSLIEAGRH